MSNNSLFSQNVRGGELSLFRKGIAGSGPTFTNLIKLAPAENMLITFRGDIPHQCASLHSHSLSHPLKLYYDKDS